MWIAQRFEDLARILVQDCQANGRRSPERIRGSLRHLRGFFRDHLAVDITSERVTRYITWRQKDGAAPATINRELAALKRAFRLAARAGKVALRPEITLLRENNRRKGFFEPNQYTSLLEHLPDYLKPVFQTAYITVMADPVRDLTRQEHHVDLDAGWLRLEPGEGKDGEGRNLPLIPGLREVLELQLEQTRVLERESDQIMPSLFQKHGRRILSFRKAWSMACRKAGLAGRIPHDFRRTAESRTRRRSSLCGYGDGRPSHGINLSPLCDRGRSNAPRAGPQAGCSASSPSILIFAPARAETHEQL